MVVPRFTPPLGPAARNRFIKPHKTQNRGEVDDSRGSPRHAVINAANNEIWEIEAANLRSKRPSVDGAGSGSDIDKFNGNFSNNIAACSDDNSSNITDIQTEEAPKVTGSGIVASDDPGRRKFPVGASPASDGGPSQPQWWRLSKP